jgi:hypothetical protein
MKKFCALAKKKRYLFNTLSPFENLSVLSFAATLTATTAIAITTAAATTATHYIPNAAS